MNITKVVTLFSSCDHSDVPQTSRDEVETSNTQQLMIRVGPKRPKCRKHHKRDCVEISTVNREKLDDWLSA